MLDIARDQAATSRDAAARGRRPPSAPWSAPDHPSLQMRCLGCRNWRPRRTDAPLDRRAVPKTVPTAFRRRSRRMSGLSRCRSRCCRRQLRCQSLWWSGESTCSTFLPRPVREQGQHLRPLWSAPGRSPQESIGALGTAGALTECSLEPLGGQRLDKLLLGILPEPQVREVADHHYLPESPGRGRRVHLRSHARGSTAEGEDEKEQEGQRLGRQAHDPPPSDNKLHFYDGLADSLRHTHSGASP